MIIKSLLSCVPGAMAQTPSRWTVKAAVDIRSVPAFLAVVPAILGNLKQLPYMLGTFENITLGI